MGPAGVARVERDRLRQERNRRAAGIPPRGAQEALEKAMGYRDEFGISYVSVLEDHMRMFAEVIPLLR